MCTKYVEGFLTRMKGGLSDLNMIQKKICELILEGLVIYNTRNGC